MNAYADDGHALVKPQTAEVATSTTCDDVIPKTEDVSTNTMCDDVKPPKTQEVATNTLHDEAHTAEWAHPIPAENMLMRTLIIDGELVILNSEDNNVLKVGHENSTAIFTYDAFLWSCVQSSQRFRTAEFVCYPPRSEGI